MNSPSNLKTIERQGEIKSLSASYPPVMQKICAMFSGQKMHVHKNKVIFEKTVRGSDLASAYLELNKNKELFNEYCMHNSGLANDLGKEINGRSSEFYGMAANSYCRELTGEGQEIRKSLDKAREELSNTGIKEQIENNLTGMKKKRSRCFSEHDGDFDLDRKWDTEPFSATKLSKKEFPYLEIIIPIGMNGGAEKSEMTMFTARCLALAEILELAGYRLSIIAESWGLDRLRASSDQAKLLEKHFPEIKSKLEQICLDRVILRDANEYGNIQDFSVLTCGEFYRRVCFSVLHIPKHYSHGMENSLNRTINYCYGTTLESRPIPVNPGQLVIDHELIKNIFGTNGELRNRIFKERISHTLKIA